MADKVGDVFEGHVTGVTHFGLSLELIDHYVEGLGQLSTLAEEFYRFIEGSHVLFGETTRRSFRLGDHVRVQVVRVDLERRMIDLAVDEVITAVRDTPRPAPRL